MCQQSCTRADLLLDDDGAPRRRSTESGERDTEAERSCGPARVAGGGSSRDGGLCEASSLSLSPANWIRRRESGARSLAFIPRAPGRSATRARGRMVSRTPAGSGSMRVNWCVSGDLGAASSHRVGRPQAGLVSKSRARLARTVERASREEYTAAGAEKYRLDAE